MMQAVGEELRWMESQHSVKPLLSRALASIGALPRPPLWRKLCPMPRNALSPSNRRGPVPPVRGP